MRVGRRHRGTKGETGIGERRGVGSREGVKWD